VEEALRIRDRRVLITTFTNENVDQINSFLVSKNGHVPENITVASWYSLLLQDGVRPYQNHITNRDRIESINFDATPPLYAKKSDIDKYYLTRHNNIYRDRVADFVCQCDQRSGGLVIKRLEKIYGSIFLDEVQDLAGYDLEILEKLLCSSISIFAVGDPRQATFSTNNASKNKKFKRRHILDWIREKEKSGLIVVTEHTDCYRCNQLICDFADALFPQLPRTNSKNATVTEHDGIFRIKQDEVLAYLDKHKPTVLRHNKGTDTMSLRALNIGLTKGRTYDRVLIFPTAPMKAYLKTKDLSKAGDLAKLYVAVTRAKYSVAFVV
jgi:hypothetical protein